MSCYLTNHNSTDNIQYFLVELSTNDGLAILPLCVLPKETIEDSIQDALEAINVDANVINISQITKQKFQEFKLLSIT